MRLYGKFFLMHLKAAMQYKAAFALLVFGNFLTSFATLLGVWFMFSRFNEVAGFTFSQILLCFATVLMAFSLAEMFARGFDQFPRMLGNGEFDRALVRPRGAIFQVLAGKMEFNRIGRVIQAIAVFCYAIPNSGVVWRADKVLTLLAMVTCGSLVFFGLFLVYAAISFFTVEGLEFMNIFTDGGREFGRYPFSVYGQNVLKVLTYVIPLALFQYYPLLYLLDLDPKPIYMLYPVASLVFLAPAYGLFRFGLRRYRSTGS